MLEGNYILRRIFRMDSRHFDSNFPRYQDFVPFIDPMFSSSYWRRVNNG